MVAIRIVLRLAALHEPDVFIAGMVYNQIQDHLHPPQLDTLQQFVEVGHGAELGHDLSVIANIVTVIRIRRVKMWAQPNNVHTQALDVVELRSNSP
jgi:hypothetical protein